jgi:Tol biopolymer transport system component
LLFGLVACGGFGGDDSTRPTVLVVSPAPDSASAVVTTRVSATFDRAMNPETIDGASFVLTGPAGDLTGTVSYDSDTNSAIFDPAEDLALGETYTGTLARTIRDSSGRTLGEAVIWSFRTAGTIVRVSLSADGVEADGCSFDPSLSENGGVLAFESLAGNLADDDAAGLPDVMRKDTQSGALTLVSRDENGATVNTPAPSSPPCVPLMPGAPFPSQFNADISGDGRYVVFQSDDADLIAGGGNGFTQVFLKDTQTEALTLISADASGVPGNGDSGNPVISRDGRFVAFDSVASNLVGSGPGADTNGVRDVFRKARDTGAIVSASIGDDNVTQGNGDSSNPDISSDGSVVVFESLATNLLGIGGDTNLQRDIYRRDVVVGTTFLVSVSADGRQANEASFAPSVTDDGRRVAFHSRATTLTPAPTPDGTSQVFLKDMARAFLTVTLVSVGEDSVMQGNGDSQRASVSGDGRFVAFDSAANNLVAGDRAGVSDIFVKAIASGAITRVSVAEDGLTEANAASFSATISADGRYVAFESDASNLVLDDFNGLRDIFRAFNRLF